MNPGHVLAEGEGGEKTCLILADDCQVLKSPNLTPDQITIDATKTKRDLWRQWH